MLSTKSFPTNHKLHSVSGHRTFQWTWTCHSVKSHHHHHHHHKRQIIFIIILLFKFYFILHSSFYIFKIVYHLWHHKRHFNFFFCLYGWFTLLNVRHVSLIHQRPQLIDHSCKCCVNWVNSLRQQHLVAHCQLVIVDLFQRSMI